MIERSFKKKFQGKPKPLPTTKKQTQAWQKITGTVSHA